MVTVRFVIALFIAKVLNLVLKITPYSGADVPGRVALSICPDFLEIISKPTRVVVVTGTEGKTTVVNLVSDCIQDTEIQVLSNAKGGNDAPGIATCLSKGVTLFGRQKYGTAVLELDPIHSKDVLPKIEPNFLMVTLLARDSASRGVHAEYSKEILTHYIPQSTKLILNGDDLVSYGVAPNNRRKVFGLKAMEGEKTINTNLIDDNATCPVCHKRVSYEYNRYSNIGKAYCPECGFVMPEPDYLGEVIEEPRDGNTHIMKKYLHITSDKREDTLPLLQDGVFNIYNEIGAVSLMLEMGVRLLDIKRALEKITIGRDVFSETSVGTINITSIMAKDRDAYSTSRVLEYISSDNSYKEVLLLNNSMKDLEEGSENTSWLYDCDFELLNNERIDKIVVYGDRGRDYVLRLLLAGVMPEKIQCVEDYLDAPDVLNYLPNERVYVIYGSNPKRMQRDILDKITDNIKIKERIDVDTKKEKMPD